MLVFSSILASLPTVADAWSWLTGLLSNQHLHYLPNILAALALGFIIGLERRQRHKSAGVRTYMIMSASAALITLTGVIMTAGTTTGDPTRMAGQILAGISTMIGAGMILKRSFSNTGVTTAAMILLAVGAGIACGFGFFGLAVTATLLVLGAVVVAGRYFGSNEYSQPVTVLCKAEQQEAVRELFGRHSLMGGFDKSQGEGLVEFTIQPELTPKETEALLERLLENESVIKAFLRDAD